MTHGSRDTGLRNPTFTPAAQSLRPGNQFRPLEERGPARWHRGRPDGPNRTCPHNLKDFPWSTPEHRIGPGQHQPGAADGAWPRPLLRRHGPRARALNTMMMVFGSLGRGRHSLGALRLLGRLRERQRWRPARQPDRVPRPERTDGRHPDATAACRRGFAASRRCSPSSRSP